MRHESALTLFCIVGRGIGRRWLAPSAFLALITISAANAQTVSTWLLNGTNLIGSSDLPSQLAASLQLTGARMTSAATAVLTLSGTTTDANGSRSSQITIQAPGCLAYREGQTRAVTYDGTAFKAKSGALSTDDERVAESFLAHFPDTVFLQVAAGGSWRRIGSHFRTDASNSAKYSGAYWTLLAFTPNTRAGLTTGRALQQQLFIAIDEHTGFMSEVRVVATTAGQQQVTQTQFSNWSNQSGQWSPATIVRLENGKQVLSFQAQSFAVGAAGPATTFAP
jgi:hypothetical protein